MSTSQPIVPTNQGTHTLAHALRPAETGCRHDKKDITTCVICGQRLKPGRVCVDTCAGNCFRQLRKMQKADGCNW